MPTERLPSVSIPTVYRLVQMLLVYVHAHLPFDCPHEVSNRPFQCKA